VTSGTSHPKRLTLELIDVTAVTGFIAWLRTSRHNSATTCNQRLAAISSFYSWMQAQDPALMACCQDIVAIPSSKHDQPAIAHLTVKQTRQLLALPDRSTRQGRRDATLLATLYDTAARVQETADLTVRDIRLKDPAIVALTGKGRKTRRVPIDTNTAALLAAYLTERRLQDPGHDHRPVFFNQHHAKLSRGGIAWILRKYQAQAADPTLASAQLSPHVLRHSRAMHLYDASVPLPYIRDILGHVNLSTTDIYARASTEAKRKALEAVYDQVVSAELTEWNQDPELLSWLANPRLTTTALCAALGHQPRSQQEIQADAAHNPALLIWLADLTVARKHRLARARSGVAGWRAAARGAGEVCR
jgi:integrase/recombinase XerD